MLDLKYFEDRTKDLDQAFSTRKADVSVLAELRTLSQRRKQMIQEVETLKSERNAVSREVGELKKKSKDDPQAAKLAEEKVVATRALGDRIKSLDDELNQIQTKLDTIILSLPNLAHASVPVGTDENSNVEARKWGTPRKFSFKPKDHVQLGELLGVLDFERAAKMSGARFTIYRAAGASLERALIQFMLDLHIKEHGYEEMITPFMVNRQALVGTGQLPKFESDLFKTAVGDRELFLLPTSEISLTNVYADEIIDGGKLPVYFTAYSPCFRSEAGSYGKDTQGLIRQHQFQKVEMVKLTHPDHSYEELEKMVANAERVLQLLELPYRVVTLCTGDMGFGSSKTYDLEVWLPGQDKYREISSCSNCEDFQARRAKIRFRPGKEEKPQYVHTLNGSGLAVGRTAIAIMENHQDEQGRVRIPERLTPYLEGKPGFVRDQGQLWMVKNDRAS